MDRFRLLVPVDRLGQGVVVAVPRLPNDGSTPASAPIRRHRPYLNIGTLGGKQLIRQEYLDDAYNAGKRRIPPKIAQG